MAPDDVALLKERVKVRLTAGHDGQVSYFARANAVKGTTPAHS
jgi:hypothetical protein